MADEGAQDISAASEALENISTVDAPPRQRASRARRRALLGVAAVVVLAGLAWGGYEWLVLSHYEDTDNAYVQGNVVQITPQIGGTVTAIYADETDRVQAGDTLVRLDGADADVTLAQAEAALGQAVRQTRTLYANNGALAATVRQRETQVASAATQLATAREDWARRRMLAASGAVSGEELEHARDQERAAQSVLEGAQAAVRVAREQWLGNQALTDGTPVERHPNVLAAAARVREAWLAAHRTTLPAPVSGWVSKRTVQLGQRVAAGAPLMAVVPLDQVWVDANFKEIQLRAVRVGQPVQLTADVYGSKVVYRGHVAGLGIVTGAASALLPAQNATGNWIKVVQRVPVRIALDPDQLREHPLRVGLSMQVRVDVRDRSGPELAPAPRTEPVARTRVFDGAGQGAEARVREIIERNLGHPAVRR